MPHFNGKVDFALFTHKLDNKYVKYTEQPNYFLNGQPHIWAERQALAFKSFKLCEL